MEAGRVCIGFSHPVVAKYNNAGGTVTYTDGMVLARGVSVSLKLEESEDNNFYADNKVAESDNGEFTGGTANLAVDGLHPAAERYISGLPEAEQVTYGESQKVGVTKHGKNAEPPYVAIGVIVQYQSGGEEIFVPVIFTKTKFRKAGLNAKTQEETKDWQTQDLVADLHRDDTAEKNWKWVADDQATEAEAIAVLHGLLNVKEAS